MTTNNTSLTWQFARALHHDKSASSSSVQVGETVASGPSHISNSDADDSTMGCMAPELHNQHTIISDGQELLSLIATEV